MCNAMKSGNIITTITGGGLCFLIDAWILVFSYTHILNTNISTVFAFRL